MSEKLKCCEACRDPFYGEDLIIQVGDELYHNDCVELYPIGYFAMRDGEPLGETENDDGTEAYDMLEDGEFLEVSE